MLFDEAWYLCTYPDVRASVVSGGLESGHYHYITYGKNEGRIPFPPVSAQGDSTKSGNIVFETELKIRLLASAAVIYAFERHRISLGERPPNFAPFIELDKSAELEPYCAFMNGSNIFSRGFSTYQYTSADFIAGRYCSIATGVSTLGERHPLEHVTTSSLAYDRGKPLFSWIRKDLLEGLQSQIFPAIPLAEGPPILEHDVWVGQHAQLARGITLHTGCVVAAGAVVTKDVPAYAIVGGNPARVIRYRFSESVIERLLISKWWCYHPRILFGFDMKNPEIFLDSIESENEKIEQYCPRKINWKDIIACL